MADIQVDGKPVSVPDKQTLLHSLRAAGMHIPGLCNNPDVEGYGACRLCLVDIDHTLQTACTVYPRPGVQIETLTDELIDMRRTALNLLLSNHQGDCIGPCQEGCPAHADIQGYVALIAMGKYHEAVRLMKQRYILPAVLGRVCPAFCEDKCRRQLVDQPLLLREAKRFAADYDLDHGPWMPDIPPDSGKKIAIVGGGPAGLSCAYYLRVKGHAVTIFEKMKKLGGMMRYAIPEYRLPRDVLDRDIAAVIDTGIHVKTGCAIGEDMTLQDLQDTYDAVFIGMGAWQCRTVNIPGNTLDGVIDGLDFLRWVNEHKDVDLGKTVLVVGGGNTAIDVARSAIRLGAEVHVIYRRSKEEMPAEPQEVTDAEEEGVLFHFLTNPIKLHGDTRVTKAELLKMKLGTPDKSGRPRPIPIENSNYVMDADTVILAIGQYTNVTELNPPAELTDNDRMICTDYCQTPLPGVFAGGDALLGPSTIIQAIATGRQAASLIDCYVHGKLLRAEQILANPSAGISQLAADETLQNLLFEIKPYNHWTDPTSDDYRHVKKVKRLTLTRLNVKDRKTTFKEVYQTPSEKDIIQEACRCMSCGCMAVHYCKLREYATLYEAHQHIYDGQQNNLEIDTSHPHVYLDNNKCVLCGQCVNTTQTGTAEGIVDYISRGFDTHIAPPVGVSLQDTKAHFLGDLVDVCPTGALGDKPPFILPGPWKTISSATLCNGCGLGCEMNIEHHGNILIRAASKIPSWNKGHICDTGRYGRHWEKNITKPCIKQDNKWHDISMKKALTLIRGHRDDMAIVIGPDATLEEAAYFKKIAEHNNMKIGAAVTGGSSTATLQDFSMARRMRIDAHIENYPYLGVLLHQAQQNGVEFVKEKYDFAILEAPAQPLKVPTLILHGGMNETGLLHMGFTSIPIAKSYLVVGNPRQKLKGFTISLGYGTYADVMVPYDAWLEKDGSVINDFNMRLSLKKVLTKSVSREWLGDILTLPP